MSGLTLFVGASSAALAVDGNDLNDALLQSMGYSAEKIGEMRNTVIDATYFYAYCNVIGMNTTASGSATVLSNYNSATLTYHGTIAGDWSSNTPSVSIASLATPNWYSCQTSGTFSYDTDMTNLYRTKFTSVSGEEDYILNFFFYGEYEEHIIGPTVTAATLNGVQMSASSIASHFETGIVGVGDVTGNWVLSALDAEAIMRYIGRTESFDARKITAADTNGDNHVDIGDVILLNQVLAGTATFW